MLGLARIAQAHRTSVAPTYIDTVLGDGAIAFWPLQEISGTIAAELVAGLNGTYSGGYTLNQAGPAGIGGKSVAFNGTSGKVVTAASTIISGAAFSAEVWIKCSAYNGGIVFDHNGVQTFEIQAGGSTQIILNFSGAAKLLSTAGRSTTAFYHTVFTSDNSGTKCYINGGLDTSNTTSWHGGTSANAVFSIAARSGTNTYFSGSLAAAAVYNTALSPAQVLNHYNLGK